MSAVVQRDLDGECDVSAVLDILGYFAGRVDGQVLPAGGKRELLADSGEEDAVRPKSGRGL